MVSFQTSSPLPCVMMGFLILLSSTSAIANIITPQMGGGSVGQALAPMKHADIFLNPSTPGLLVGLDNSIATPELRSLTAPDVFDASQPWSVMNGKAHNFQHGWNVGAPFLPDAGTWVWIEQTAASPGLEVYDRTPSSLDYTPIFGTEGSSTRWRWSGSMTHNVYAVENPTSSEYFAEYSIYFGDDTTGEPIDGYSASNVRFDFAFDPPPVGDFNQDGFVTAADYDTWVNQYGQAGAGLTADDNHDLKVDAADFSLWRDAIAQQATATATAVPEPSSTMLLFMMITIVMSRRNQWLAKHNLLIDAPRPLLRS